MKKVLIIIIVSIVIFIAAGYGLLILSNSRDFQFYGGLVTKADTDEKVVALTFDDGPTKNTDQILKILKDADVKATFFLTGREIKENFGEAEKIVLAGHELGNHSYSHKRMILKTPTFIKNEIETTDALIKKTGYKGPIEFRPPYGKKLVGLPRYLDKQNRKTILWNIEPDSYPEIASDSQKIVEHVNKNIEPGSIILLHVMYGSRTESIEAVKDIVDSLKAKGYKFKKVSEMVE
ncbi:polysaccharide deacetylase family protein [Bacillus sp. NEB1478]|uniref:polysaccharide deacetylase family protein n=1 Tax=Bacillus sp. NEB1478 TaxID=3073816 RepID=UPI0028732A2F|nr:polysaccharide deacetylase family protein [Bacillus sp. NEB1478]WNB91114.1 polysaccharide deacetylase family protein [Bacillus sp. NEB1478]